MAKYKMPNKDLYAYFRNDANWEELWRQEGVALERLRGTSVLRLVTTVNHTRVCGAAETEKRGISYCVSVDGYHFDGWFEGDPSIAEAEGWVRHSVIGQEGAE